MNWAQKMYRGETSIDFISRRKTYFIVSGIVLGLILGSVSLRGFEGSVDFTGGVIIDAPNVAGATVTEVRDALDEIGLSAARVQFTDSGAGVQSVLIQTEALDNDGQDALIATVAQITGVSTADTNLSAVGPTFGAEITARAIRALVIFLIVVAVFISWRFEWKMAAAGLAALFHDLAITAGIYSIFSIQVTPATVIAILTILGYSLYDTVVVFDKVKENVDEIGTRHSFAEIANLSMNQVLMRSLNTSMTSLVPVGSLLVVGSILLGAATLQEFALALFIGVAAGTYSSIFIATPLLTVWKEREEDWARAARRRSGAGVLTATEVTVEAAKERVAAAAPPRAPKHRKKHR
ncbi:MAG TPA: protein translocase subunit SecF [Actinobacteria bacterium]|nr:preprotein translocase subunit SecF [bacterium BMS3Bbin02]HDL42024.1 protein translocase subunit SecF [Actinomycetota bacterium]